MLSLNSKSLFFIRNSQLIKKSQSSTAASPQQQQTPQQTPQQIQQQHLDAENKRRGELGLQPYQDYNSMIDGTRRELDAENKRRLASRLTPYNSREEMFKGRLQELANENQRRSASGLQPYQNYNSMILEKQQDQLVLENERRKRLGLPVYEDYNSMTSGRPKELNEENQIRKSMRLAPFRNAHEMNSHIKAIKHRYDLALRAAYNKGEDYGERFLIDYPTIYAFELSLQRIQQNPEGDHHVKRNWETDADEDHIMKLILTGEDLTELKKTKHGRALIFNAKANFPNRFPDFNALNIGPPPKPLPPTIKSPQQYLNYLEEVLLESVEIDETEYPLANFQDLKQLVINDKSAKINKTVSVQNRDRQAAALRQQGRQLRGGAPGRVPSPGLRRG